MRLQRPVLWLALLTSFSFAGSVHAASAYTITPAFQEATLDTQRSVDVSIDLDNNTATDQSFKLSTADFGSLNESGGVAFLGSGTSDFGKRYGLVSWLQLGTNVVFVPAGQSVTIKAEIQNRDSLAPGGHYGAILATAITDTGEPKNVAPQVGLHAVLSSLILLTKSGGSKPALELLSETSNHSAFKLPTTIDQRFQNAGNVHVVPRGTIVIKDPSGRIVSQGALNEDSVFILPESFRHVSVDLSSLARAYLPGRYSVTTTYRFDGSDAVKTYTDHIWYAGNILVILSWVIVGLALIGAGYYVWRRQRVKTKASLKRHK